ncbi:MAG TPA: MBL fold metallo-hydrolase [Alcaligenes faecalis]|nr:MBL fold metallo-hydrolase [Alcaligenes faecalis]
MKRRVGGMVLAGILSAVSLCASAEKQPEATARSVVDDFSVTLLGTGSVIPRADRFGTSTLVQAGGQNLLFDVGRGSFQRLWQAGLSRNDINAVFLTHLHSDHTVGLPDLYLSGGTIDTVARRLAPRPFVIYGPQATPTTRGTKGLMDGIREAYQADSAIREREQRQPAEIAIVQAHEIKPGVVYEHDGVKVTAFPVDHGESKPAFGYRVDYDGRSVVLSGDTNYKPDEPLLRAGKGADVVIHEVLVLGPNFREKNSAAAQSIGDKHTSPAEAGKVFAHIQPKLGVFNHIEWVYDQTDNDAGVIADISEQTKASYEGPFLVGADLDKIVIGKEGVAVVKPRYEVLPSALR